MRKLILISVGGLFLIVLLTVLWALLFADQKTITPPANPKKVCPPNPTPEQVSGNYTESGRAKFTFKATQQITEGDIEIALTSINVQGVNKPTANVVYKVTVTQEGKSPWISGAFLMYAQDSNKQWRPVLGPIANSGTTKNFTVTFRQVTSASLLSGKIALQISPGSGTDPVLVRVNVPTWARPPAAPPKECQKQTVKKTTAPAGSMKAPTKKPTKTTAKKPAKTTKKKG